MNRVPVDQSVVNFVCVSIEPKTDFETGEVKHSFEGVPQWLVTVMAQPVAVPGERSAKPSIIAVTIAADTAPDCPPMSPAQFERLTVSAWAQNGRREGADASGGLSYTAKSVRPASTRPKVAAPPANGNKPEPAPQPA